MSEREESLRIAMTQGAEHREADIAYLCEQLGIPCVGPQKEIIAGFHNQLWQVAAQAGFDAGWNAAMGNGK
jgi:hypothetical protein